MKETATSMERVLAALSNKESDRVPFFLMLTMHGAKELGMTVKDYFMSAQAVAEGQVRMQEKYGHDCYYNFTYAAIEVEAWGGEVVFRADGPPNSGRPVIQRMDDIRSIQPPAIREAACLQRMLEATRLMAAESRGRIPVIGIIISPFSLPVMQMGFDNYLDLIYEDEALFWTLMGKNIEFGVELANAQLEAGAAAIGYFDPVSSPTIIPRELYLKTGHVVAKRTLSRIKGPVASHHASGRVLPIMSDIIDSGAKIVGVSAMEDLSLLKKAAQGRATLLGNLNGIEMRRWTRQDAEAAVKDTIRKAGRGGGFILSDNHGEVPFQVPEEVLLYIADAVRMWGRYPIEWAGAEAA